MLTRCWYRISRLIAHFGPIRGILQRRILAPLRAARIRRIREALPGKPGSENASFRRDSSQSASSQPAATPDTSNGPVMLVLALRPWAVQRGWETVLGQLVREQGVRLVWAECEGLMPRCEAMTGSQRDPGLCGYCCDFNQRAASAAGVDRIRLADLIEPDDVDSGQSYPEHPDVDITWASFQRLLAAQRRKGDPLAAGERQILDEFLVSSERMRRVAPRLLDRVQPDIILTLNGKFAAEAIVIEEAERRGITVWGYERGAHPGTIFLERGTALPYPTDDVIAELETHPLDPEQQDAIDRLLDQRRANRSSVSDDGSTTPAIPELADGCRRVVLFTNVIWDAAVIGEDTIYPSMFEWIHDTIDAVSADPNTQLVIRVHPAEVEVYWHPTRDQTVGELERRFPEGLPDNVVVIGPTDRTSSYDLMETSELILAYSSTVGMEAAAMGRRVMTAARSHYHEAPFVVRAQDRNHYLTELARRDSTPHRPDVATLARRYLYHLYFEKMVSVPPIREGRVSFTIHENGFSDEALAPLRDRLEELLTKSLVDTREMLA